MKRTILTALQVAALAAVLATPAVAAARGSGSSKKRASTANPCVLQGRTPLPRGLGVYDRAIGGKLIASFPGAPVALRASGFPTDAKRKRARLRTGSGRGGFRIKGFVDAAQLPLRTTREIPVYGSHVRLGKSRPVRFVRATSSKIQVKMSLTQTIRQTFQAWASCSDLSLQPERAPVAAVPGAARGYVVTADRLSLYSHWGPSRSRVTMLRGVQGLLTWATDAPQSGFVHIGYRGPVVIDAWAKLSDFRVLPPGETEDRLLPPTSQQNAPVLRLADTPQEVLVTNRATLYSAPRADARQLGAIEPETPTYVVDVVLGWASVLPKSLNITPPGEAQFWVRARDIGLED